MKEMKEKIIEYTLEKAVDWGVKKIEEKIRTPKNSSSYFTRIYQMTVEVITEFSVSYHIKQEKLYDSAEVFTDLWIKEGMITQNTIQSTIKNLGITVNDYEYERFKEILYDHIINDPNIYNRFLINSNESLALMMSENAKEKKCNNTKIKNNIKNKYIEKWNGRLFLSHAPNLVKHTLGNTFVLPKLKITCNCYTADGNIERMCCDLNKEEEGKKYLKKIFSTTNNTVLVVGPPGMGKSSIISFLSKQYEGDDRVIVLRFRDLKCDDVSKNGLLLTICEYLMCTKYDLEGKILTLDGLDESAYITDDDVKKFLIEIEDIDALTIFVTSRPGYVSDNYFKVKIELQIYDDDRIKKYSNIIDDNFIIGTQNINAISSIGIPVILYMIIMSDLKMDQKLITRAQIYQKIFSLHGGIFDKFSYTPYYKGYDTGFHVMKIDENKKIYLSFLKEIAYKMLLNRELKLELKNCDLPIIQVNDRKISILEFPIKSLFEGIKQIEFVHASIYEYFASKYILDMFGEIYDAEKTSTQIRNEIFEAVSAIEWKSDIMIYLSDYLTYEVAEKMYNFLKRYRAEFICYFPEKFKGDIPRNFFRLNLIKFFNYIKLLEISRKNISIFNRIEIDPVFFADILQVLQNHNIDEIKLNYLSINNFMIDSLYLENDDLSNSSFENSLLQDASFVKYRLNNMNFEHSFIVNSEFCISDIKNSIFFDSNVHDTVFRSSNLRETDFSNATLINVEFINCDLQGADFENAHFADVKFTNVDISQAYFSDVKIEETYEGMLKNATFIIQ